MGSNKVLRVALGHGAEDEYKAGLSALADDISGSIGLFFTRLPQDQVPIQLHFNHSGWLGVKALDRNPSDAYAAQRRSNQLCSP